VLIEMHRRMLPTQSGALVGIDLAVACARASMECRGMAGPICRRHGSRSALFPQAWSATPRVRRCQSSFGCAVARPAALRGDA